MVKHVQDDTAIVKITVRPIEMTIRHHIYRVMTAISLHLVPNILLQPQAQHILCQTVVMRAAELVTIRAICLFGHN